MPKRKVILEGAQTKPSLASLKPQKGESDAAKKRAVKRIVASASKKAPPARTKKFSATLETTTLPKLQTTLLKSKVSHGAVFKDAPKNRVKKTVAKEVSQKIKISATKATEKKSSKQTFLNKPKAIPSPFAPEPVVRLPKNMSIRAREKALVILQQAIQDFQKPAQQIAYVSGLCFVVLGSYLALSFTGILPATGGQQAALVSSSASSTGISLAVSENFKAPTFSLLDKIPPSLTGNSQYTFSLTHVKNVAVKLYSLEDGMQSEVAVDELIPGTHRYTIEAGKLKSGQYVAKVSAESDTDASKYTYELGAFSITHEETESVASSTATSTKEKNIIKEEKKETATTTQPIAEVHSNMRLNAGAELSGQTTIAITAPSDTRFVEIYVRPVRSINARFLGLAEEKDATWYYFFNTINVPNGDYELFARTRIDDSFYESNSVNTRITNIAAFTMSEINDGSKPLEEGQTIEDVATPVRTFAEYSFEDASTSASFGGAVTAEADKIFAEHRDKLNELLKRYAVAVQSGDKLLTQTALDELLKLKDTILLEILNDSSRNYLADNISQEFDDRLESIKKRISTFEELRRTAGSEDTRADKDGDGISDFDERNLYHTNAEIADTDNDGFNDGIEIMRGFDPRSPLGETVINYQLPQNAFGLVQDDTLQIDAVQPLINHISDTETIVQSEIRGTALPNSYVTLYVFSNPSITTVRTGADGSFSYTFEKELEDGEHQVFAAITDNTGAIVAISEPYAFVKDNSVFTPANALTAAGGTLSRSDISRFNTYNAIIGIGILALGVILILLGASLRRREVIPVLDTLILKTK